MLDTVVVVGGGIIGMSTAYFLAKPSHRPSRIVVLEKETIACAASGKAGGFMARDWGCDVTRCLHEAGYDLHQSIAKELGIESYHEFETGELSLRKRKKSSSLVHAKWLAPEANVQHLSTSTAQVNPKELIEKLMGLLRQQAGVEIFEGVTVQGLERKLNGGCEGKGLVTGVLVKEIGQPKIIPCDAVAICCGPWTGVLLEQWFKDDDLNIPMEGIKSTAIIFGPGSRMADELSSEPMAVFCEESVHGTHLELFSRRDGSIYICGCGGSDHVKGARLRPGGEFDTAHKVKADPRRVEAAMHSLKDILRKGLLPSEPDTTHACMRPCPHDGLPYMGSLSDIDTPNVFVCAGHNCWGILWSLVSGKAIAELITTGKSSDVSLDAFSPLRCTMRIGKNRGRNIKNMPVGEQW